MLSNEIAVLSMNIKEIEELNSYPKTELSSNEVIFELNDHILYVKNDKDRFMVSKTNKQVISNLYGEQEYIKLFKQLNKIEGILTVQKVIELINESHKLKDYTLGQLAEDLGCTAVFPMYYDIKLGAHYITAEKYKCMVTLASNGNDYLITSNSITKDNNMCLEGTEKELTYPELIEGADINSLVKEGKVDIVKDKYKYALTTVGFKIVKRFEKYIKIENGIIKEARNVSTKEIRDIDVPFLLPIRALQLLI